ncbi:MAG: D-alanyl-D-alanine carboxypeptidase/D-alanyl-D-alanine-endopeptidase [Planctomycetes bacterium]|nr:D-alanyl-D-alanine carboxypeptidase/D-alanyl-D-alanine-endopeptidase [Planctomycetota bacterium]
MSTRSKKSGGARALRIGLLLAANVACVWFLWQWAATGGASAQPTAEAERGGGVVAAAEPAQPRPLRTRDADLEARVRACIAQGERSAVALAQGRVRADQCTVSVHVREVGCSGELVAIGADRAMRPASNMKLVTTAAALVLFGSQGAFQTIFESPAALQAGVLQGDLVAHAGGDPLYRRENGGDAAELLAPVVAQLKAAGVTRIAGALVLDEGTFAPPSPGPAWPASNQHWQEFCALAGGFSANAGCLTAVVATTRNGAPAEVNLFPRGHGLATRIGVVTGAAKSKLDVRVGVAGGTARVEGSIPPEVPRFEARFAAPDPVLLFGGALLDALERGGIQVDGGLLREQRRLEPGARVLAQLVTPLTSVLVPINTWSNNACADQLFLTMGKRQFGQGTREAGGAATAHALERLGVDARGLVQVDGSGLSRDNRITARQITALVDAVLTGDPSAARAFRESLAVGGETGTLDKRLAALEGRVHAKTGFIAGTSALSGFLNTVEGRTYAFSILVEYPNVEGLNKNCWKPMEDEICAVLAADARG